MERANLRILKPGIDMGRRLDRKNPDPFRTLDAREARRPDCRPGKLRESTGLLRKPRQTLPVEKIERVRDLWSKEGSVENLGLLITKP